MDSALQLFANAGDGVFAVDQEQSILFWSALATETLGYSAQEAIGQPCWKLLDGKSVTGRQICCPDCPIFQKIKENKPVHPFDLVVKNHAGQYIKINVSSIGLPSSEEDITGLIHIQRKV